MLSNAPALIRRLATPLWRAALVGMLLGALVGGLALHSERRIEATALIRLYQPLDPDQIITNSAPTSETQQSYISGEIAYLNSPGFTYAAGKQLGGPPPTGLTAVQDTQSSVVSLSATGPDFAAAQRIVNAGIDAYRNHLQEQTRDRSQAAMGAIDDVIERLGESPATGGSAESDVAARVAQLEAQRLAIDVQDRRGAPLQVVQPPTADGADGVPSWWLGAIGGGLLGGLLTIASATAWRRRRGVLTTTAAVEADLEHVLLPTVRLDRLDPSSPAYAQLARSLYAQLPQPRSGCTVVIGASAESGTAPVAALIAAGVEEHEPARVLHLADGYAPSGFGMKAVTIIDAGSVDSSPSLPDAMTMADQIIVVAMLGHDVRETLRVAGHLAGRSGVPVSAICTRGRVVPSAPAVPAAGGRPRHSVPSG